MVQSPWFSSAPSRRRRPWLTLSASGALLAATLLTAGGSAAAGPNPASRFTRVTKQSVSGFRPASLDKTPADYMLQLAGDPVTVAAAHADHRLSKAERSSLQSQLKAAQAPVTKAAKGVGAKVLGSYQLVYNGVKVHATAAQASKLAQAAGVVGIHRMTPVLPDNVHGVPLIGAPQAWGGVAGLEGFAGEGIKIADIDTGIDYTHADFGGPGTPAAYQAALATDTAAPDPTLIGPNAPKVKGGTDLVGDAYNASDTKHNVPNPDPNPLDCNGHGTHTAGTAAGFGVLSDGSTYNGSYDADTVSSHDWNVGPGAAPKADIYSIRVFGCTGSTNVVVDAIEWAVAHDMDVINMSLGSPFGGPDDPDAVASDNASLSGVIVVASAGNNGPNPYVDGTPATSTRAISVAASDPTQTFPAATISLPGGGTVTAIDANGIPVNGLNAPIKVLYTGSTHDAAHISLGCDPAEYTAAGVAGDIVVVKRGTCARVARAIFGQQAGAAAVVMVNSDNTFPPYEGQITSNPDNGTPYTVTIPFLGVRISDGPALVAADGATVTLTDTTLDNPGYLGLASFSSGGPRSGDSWLKPDVTAPGVSIASAGMGTGNGSLIESGTSMAAPHTTGAAALVRQAHPTWTAEQVKAALVNTADPSLVSNYRTRVAGAGFVQVQHAVASNVVAIGDPGTATLNFGFAEFIGNYSKARQVHVTNTGSSAVTFDVSHTRDSGRPHSVLVPSSITVPAHGSTNFSVTLSVPVATAGSSAAFHDAAGLIRLAPRNGANNGVTLDVPYYLVPTADSKLAVHVPGNAFKSSSSATVTISNGGAITGAADWYGWGVSDARDTGGNSNDIRAIGVQSFPDDGVLAIAIDTWGSASNFAQDEFDVYADVNGDGTSDYLIVGADLGALTAGSANGQDAAAVINLATGSGTIEFLADAPFNGRTLVLPVLFDQLCDSGSPCLDASHPVLAYHAFGFGPDGSADQTAGTASFNVFEPSVNTGMFDPVEPGSNGTETLTVNRTRQTETPALGWMAIVHDNAAANEAELIALP